MNILNCSYMEARLPSSWKEDNISPIPKQKPILDVNSHLRPISLTPILSKVADDFVVEGFVKPALLKKVDSHRFGAISGSNTWNKATDGSGATIRAVLFDFKKAFYLIDHHILVQKSKFLKVLSTGLSISWHVVNSMSNLVTNAILNGEIFHPVFPRVQSSGLGCL